MGTETPASAVLNFATVTVEKMGPFRRDGNFETFHFYIQVRRVEKMGPLRGDGNATLLTCKF